MGRREKKRKEGEERWAGGKKERRKGKRVGPRRGEKERGGLGWKKEKGREREEGFKSFLFFFQTFSNFKLLNLNSFQNLNTSSLFQSFQNILKTFKTSHKQPKPCIRIMMHKHLLLLKLLK
jgi:hypothetical protein